MPALSKDIGEKAAGFQALRGNTGAPSYSWQEDPDTGFILLPGAIGVVVDGVLVGSLPADLGGAPGGASGQVQFNAAGAFAGDTGMTFNSTTDVLTLAGGLVSPSVGPAAAQQHTLPAVASDTVALLAAAQALTNKTIALGSNTVTGTTAQFNTALTDNDFATLAGAETLTNKVIGSGSTLNNMSVGPHSLGGATSATTQFRMLGSFSGDVIWDLLTTITAGANTNAYGVIIEPTLVEAASGNAAEFVAFVMAPNITPGAATLTDAIGFQVNSITAPTGTTRAVAAKLALPTGATTNGIFDFPVNATDPTGGGGAATGRVPCIIGGVQRYLAYY